MIKGCDMIAVGHILQRLFFRRNLFQNQLGIQWGNHMVGFETKMNAGQVTRSSLFLTSSMSFSISLTDFRGVRSYESSFTSGF